LLSSEGSGRNPSVHGSFGAVWSLVCRRRVVGSPEWLCLILLIGASTSGLRYEKTWVGVGLGSPPQQGRQGSGIVDSGPSRQLWP
jgi:hypothetical protein